MDIIHAEKQSLRKTGKTSDVILREYHKQERVQQSVQSESGGEGAVSSLKPILKHMAEQRHTESPYGLLKSTGSGLLRPSI